MYDDLKGKVAIVTGAGRPNGLGQGMAKRFAREGCHVVITDVARPHADPEYGRGKWEDLLERQKEIEALGARCLPLKCDVTVEEEVQAMVDAVIEEFGRVDILVNNVGGGPPGSGGPLLEVDGANWDEGIAVNAKGTHLCSRAAAKRMIEKGEGGKLLDEGITQMSGELPVNPSGGVLSTNPIGATALVRVAEAAIQVMGRGEKRQVSDVEKALSMGFGGSLWTELLILGKEPMR